MQTKGAKEYNNTRKSCTTSVCLLAKGSFLYCLPSIENGYSQLGSQTIIGVIVTDKGKDMLHTAWR